MDIKVCRKKSKVLSLITIIYNDFFVDCAQILIRSDFEIRNSDFDSGIRTSDYPAPGDSTVNLFTLMMKNGWKGKSFKDLFIKL